MFDISITVKTAHTKVTEKDIIHDNDLMLAKHNPFLIQKVKDAVEKLGLHPEEESPKITVKAVLRWQE